MKITVTSEQMQELDRRAIEEYGIPSIVLMENAGRGVAELVFGQIKSGRVSIFSGKGNNGGDGFVIARHLQNRGYQVSVILAADPKQLKSDAAINFAILEKMKVPITIFSGSSDINTIHSIVANTDLVIDALFGVGLHSEVRGIYRKVIHLLNEARRKTFSVDVPSGLNSDTGQIMGECIRASITATLGLPKKGLFEEAGPEYAGRIALIDIGLPSSLTQELFSKK